MKRIVFFIIIISLILYCYADPIKIARIHYNGGGDWYNDPEIIPNLADFSNNILKQETFAVEEKIIKLSNNKIFNYPFLFMTGHGKVSLSDIEISNLRKHLLNGGFLYIDDDYGMDKFIRKEIKKIFPDKSLTEISADHDIFNSYFNFPEGLPKIHKHDNERPRAYAIFNKKGRLLILYTYESNISDGWASERTHKDPYIVREKALKFGFNVLYYLING